MNLTFYGLLVVSFIALHIHDGSCGNYGQIEKRGAEEKPNELMKDVFTRKEKRHTDNDGFESNVEEDKKRKKRDATDIFKEGFENFKERAKEGMDKMKTMFAPKSKREVPDFNQVARNKRQGEDKFGRNKREALESPMNNNRLVHYDVRESYETKYTFI